MLVSKCLDTPIMIEFQMSLVVVLESHLQIMNASAEGSGQGRSPMTQKGHVFPFCTVDPSCQLCGSNGAAINYGGNGDM